MVVWTVAWISASVVTSHDPQLAGHITRAGATSGSCPRDRWDSLRNRVPLPLRRLAVGEECVSHNLRGLASRHVVRRPICAVIVTAHHPVQSNPLYVHPEVAAR